jgi:hypothetical protein
MARGTFLGEADAGQHDHALAREAIMRVRAPAPPLTAALAASTRSLRRRRHRACLAAKSRKRAERWLRSVVELRRRRHACWRSPGAS